MAAMVKSRIVDRAGPNGPQLVLALQRADRHKVALTVSNRRFSYYFETWRASLAANYAVCCSLEGGLLSTAFLHLRQALPPRRGIVSSPCVLCAVGGSKNIIY
jgi:hypothetical protein